ncbi:TPA: cysteine peptidase family C39 domain-containing protein [Escherichia coli]
MNKRKIYHKPVPLFIQNGMYECAIACVKMILHYHNIHAETVDIINVIDRKNGPYSILDIIYMFNKFGINACGYCVDTIEIEMVKAPCIVHLSSGHFVVLAVTNNIVYTIHDPIFGIINLSQKEFNKEFSGFIIEIDIK